MRIDFSRLNWSGVHALTKRIAGAPLHAWRFFKRFLFQFMEASFIIFLILFIPFFIGNFVLSTPKAKAYRNLHPSLPVCQEGLSGPGWSVLADVGAEKSRVATIEDESNWTDPSNNELDVINFNKSWATKLRCALQKHIVPSSSANTRPLEYHLGFLEFQESGAPYTLKKAGPLGDESITGEEIKEFSVEYGGKPPLSQLDILEKHLASGSNYVIVFAHGWRHNADIGDSNVADLRLYAAHVARFLRERCNQGEERYCEMKVTAILVGWRGARVDEIGLRRLLGDRVGGFLGEFAAGATLFDRKPVSEQVSPAAISAIRTLERVLFPREPNGKRKPEAARNRMIVLGHSLGGNLLATGLKDDLIKLVEQHVPGENVPPVLGDLVVLLNPASEAAKWTEIQRAVWRKIPFNPSDVITMEEVAQGHKFFSSTQRPIILSVTAALAFPAGGLRQVDCEWLALDIDDRHQKARDKINKNLEKNEGMFSAHIDYDWATHDLFPAFKFDFRPMAGWFDRKAARIEGLGPPGQSCDKRQPSFISRLESLPVRIISKFLSTFPFQNTNPEYSHTIGHLDPPRPAAGKLVEHLTSASPFGTTHELMGSYNAGGENVRETHHPYATLADAQIECPSANRWLSRARARRPPHGTLWDSGDLEPSSSGAVGEGPPAAQFLHSFNLGGMAPITRANDPFWNVRAFDNALSRHDGYRLTSFICAMNQFVLDEITSPEAVALGPPAGNAAVDRRRSTTAPPETTQTNPLIVKSANEATPQAPPSVKSR